MVTQTAWRFAENIACKKVMVENAPPATYLEECLEMFPVLMAFMALGGLFLIGMGFTLIHFDDEIAESVAYVVDQL